MSRIVAPYGSWPSPITAMDAARSGARPDQLRAVGNDLFWTEVRPGEQGRTVAVHRARDGRRRDLTPAGYNVRSRVHEYGGGAFCLGGDWLFFCNDADQRVYRQKVAGGAPETVTPEGRLRFADLTFDPARRRLLAVCEDHSGAGEPVNTLVAIALDGSGLTTLATGRDFFASPAPSADGRTLAWIAWDHPHMPWRATTLWLAELDHDGRPATARAVAGGGHESVQQPMWSPSGELYFVSDASGFWNLHRLHSGQRVSVAPMRAELARPQWVFGRASYGFRDPHHVVANAIDRARSGLLSIEVESGRVTPIASGCNDVETLAITTDGVAFIGASGTSLPAVHAIDLASGARRTFAVGSDALLAPFASEPEPIEFASAEGRSAFAFLYLPANPGCGPTPGSRPPLMVMGHGGPTSMTAPALNAALVYWLSRGFAVADVNYGGSTGFGRAYQDLLAGNWGVVDVEDCCAVALHLAAAGRVDPERLVIRGRSAGGYTTLCALAFRDVFKAGASHYGICDLAALARDTHKFESRYTDWLVAPYPARADVYAARSPLLHAERLRAPVIFFQGLEDKMVPPEQSERMAAALRARRVPVAYVAFAGEQHGFRKAENVARSLEAELAFYARVLRFALPEPVPTFAIDNLS
jgi:dipeptidyl aminopeptidase/acylaminoacyl peptidase